MAKTNIKGTAQKIKFSIKDFSSKCDKIRSFLKKWKISFLYSEIGGGDGFEEEM